MRNPRATPRLLSAIRVARAGACLSGWRRFPGHGSSTREIGDRRSCRPRSSPPDRELADQHAVNARGPASIPQRRVEGDGPGGAMGLAGAATPRAVPPSSRAQKCFLHSSQRRRRPRSWATSTSTCRSCSVGGPVAAAFQQTVLALSTRPWTGTGVGNPRRTFRHRPGLTRGVRLLRPSATAKVR